MVKLINILKEILGKVNCSNCGWTWSLSDGGKDPFVCHKCGYNNSPKTGEFLSKNEEKLGLWANIRAKRARGEAPAKKGSKAYKKAVKAAKDINQ
jgi:ribosomal protein S27AE